ncbi:MAG TPA: response regulator transcription factor [Blastocatellia bacterium]|jgi:DNA-binding NarL/FixJ family response regulator|nr:response regulator transcription factor [Blastocatellia bacterium]
MPSNEKDPIKVLLVDDHVVVRTALRMLIQSRPGLTMVGEAGNRADALLLAARELPDIILLDLELDGESGLDFLPELLNTSADARIIILTGVRDTEAHHRAVSLGAVGVVRKDNAVDVLIEAIVRVHAGEAWLDPSLTARVLSGMSRGGKARHADPEAAKIATLTGREREVLSVVGEGLKNKEIASRLFISEWTVRHHLTSIFDKLQVSDRVELILYAYRHNLAKPPR